MARGSTDGAGPGWLGTDLANQCHELMWTNDVKPPRPNLPEVGFPEATDDDEIASAPATEEPAAEEGPMMRWEFLKKRFKIAETMASGYVDRYEFKALLEEAGMSLAAINAILNGLDQNGNGRLSYFN